ncbi:hypothetical protein, partial [Rhizobium leguminosarum]|uniref:hypothetical protein n=1 Tax=Rhizobium leguminosarum TaxID=384 RepID=UPI001C9734EE
ESDLQIGNFDQWHFSLSFLHSHRPPDPNESMMSFENRSHFSASCSCLSGLPGFRVAGAPNGSEPEFPPAR